MDHWLALEYGMRRNLLLWAFNNRHKRNDDPQRLEMWRLLLADLRRLRYALRAGNLDAARELRQEVNASIWRLQAIYVATQPRVDGGQGFEARRDVQRRDADRIAVRERAAAMQRRTPPPYLHDAAAELGIGLGYSSKTIRNWVKDMFKTAPVGRPKTR